MSIADKTVLITGASRGIGQALTDEALGRASLAHAGAGPLEPRTSRRGGRSTVSPGASG